MIYTIHLISNLTKLYIKAKVYILEFFLTKTLGYKLKSQVEKHVTNLTEIKIKIQIY